MSDPTQRRLVTAIVVLWLLLIALGIFGLGMWVGSVTT